MMMMMMLTFKARRVELFDRDTTIEVLQFRGVNNMPFSYINLIMILVFSFFTLNLFSSHDVICAKYYLFYL